MRPKATGIEMQSADAEKAIPSISMKTEAEEGTVYNPMNEVLERLNKLESENRAMKDELAKQNDNVFANRRKKYDGPLKYSYKIWEGQPIVDYRTVTMTQERDWNNNGKYNNYHLVEITLANGKKMQIEYERFAQGYIASEKLFVEETIDRQDGRYYKFKVDGISFEIPEKLIN